MPSYLAYITYGTSREKENPSYMFTVQEQSQ